MQFLYFVPNKNRDLLKNILYAFDSKPLDREVLRGGPNGGRGFIFFDSSAMNRIAQVTYDPGSQTWRKMPGQEIWIGYMNDEPPTAKDLARKSLIPGHSIELGDGGQWTIPCCRYFGEDGFSCGLPQVMDLDENGDWTVGNVLPKHQKLWDASAQWFDAISTMDGEDLAPEADMTIADVANACVVALGTNYRVSALEVGMLGLLTSSTRSDIMNMTIDYPAIEDWSKKKEVASD
jgi:hypothetical protein